MTVHTVKSWSHFFKAIKRGDKKHDLRVNDRDYKLGDVLVLQEYDPAAGVYTGHTCCVRVSYITSNQFPCAFSSAVMMKNYCILSLELLGDAGPDLESTSP